MPIKSNFCCLYRDGCVVLWSVVDLSGTSLLKKTDSNSYHWQPFLDWGWDFVPHSLLHDKIYSSLSWNRSHAYCYNCCEFVCATSHCVQKTLFPHSHPQHYVFHKGSWALKWGGSIQIPHLELSTPMVSCSLHLDQLCLCVKLYLLQKESALMRVERCSNLWE